mgnify:CR=1
MTIRQIITAIKNGDAGKAQFIRFIINGCVAAGVHYGVYLLALIIIDSCFPTIIQYMSRNTATSVAYVIGYLVSFAVNFYFTCVFTFRATPSLRRFIGFSGSHAVNFLLHVVLFSACMHIGIHPLIAPFVVMAIAMLVQFTILKFVFKKR